MITPEVQSKIVHIRTLLLKNAPKVYSHFAARKMKNSLNNSGEVDTGNHSGTLLGVRQLKRDNTPDLIPTHPDAIIKPL